MINSSDFTIMGVGGAGCRFLNTLSKTPGAERLNLLALDTDRESLENSGLPPEKTLLAGENWRLGRGCGGNVSDGRSAVGNARNAIDSLLGNTKMLMVIGGLGGGTGSGGIATVLSAGAKKQIPTLALVTLPFSHEGDQRRQIASSALEKTIFDVANAVIALPNDLLFSSLSPTAPIAEAYKLADEQIARTALALSAQLCAGNLLNADFTTFSNMLMQEKSRCSVGVGVARRDNGTLRPETAIENMLSSPLLGGCSNLQNADAVIFNILGGPSLSIGDVQTIFGKSVDFIRQETQILTSAATSPEWEDMIQFTALAIKYKKPLKPQAESKHTGVSTREVTDSLFSNNSMEQPALPFVPVSKGIMESTLKVIWQGKDLDIPTYIRNEISIDSGKMVSKNTKPGN
jgi:cell division protein FtsZ